MTCMTMKRKAKESDVEPLTATDYMEALPYGMTGLSVRVQREVLQKWQADEQEVARLRGLLEGVANGDGYTTQLGNALIMKCDTYGKTDLHYRLERALADTPTGDLWAELSRRGEAWLQDVKAKVNDRGVVTRVMPYSDETPTHRAYSWRQMGWRDPVPLAPEEINRWMGLEP